MEVKGRYEGGSFEDAEQRCVGEEETRQGSVWGLIKAHKIWKCHMKICYFKVKNKWIK